MVLFEREFFAAAAGCVFAFRFSAIFAPSFHHGSRHDLFILPRTSRFAPLCFFWLCRAICADHCRYSSPLVPLSKSTANGRRGCAFVQHWISFDGKADCSSQNVCSFSRFPFFVAKLAARKQATNNYACLAVPSSPFPNHYPIPLFTLVETPW